ncbi:MAG: EF-hand domain-containing protein [Brevundimonas sp.]|nr:MAG: EF-hand domain-containing protein [Brevundimonas sp.]
MARMQAADTDSDGRISRAEFTAKAAERMRAADSNGGGSVSAEERQAAGAAHRAEAMAQRFARLDTNSGGAISRAEFEAAPARGGRGQPGGRGEMRRGRHGGEGPAMAGHMGQRRDGQSGPMTIAQVEARMGERFTRMDANGGGYLDAQESAGARAAMGERRQERRERMHQRRDARSAMPSPATPPSE